MSGKFCPKCRKKSADSIECDSCGVIFEGYERLKQESLAQVYNLISTGDLEGAKKLAEPLPMEFPDNRSDFLLLLSNINRDISIVAKYQQAEEAFGLGDYSQVTLLLRNIKAFDNSLDEKVITLRRKAERYSQHDTLFDQAVEEYNGERFAAAKTLFKKIEGYKRQSEVDEYLCKIKKIKKGLLREATDCLGKNRFDSALVKFDELHAIFPDMQHETEDYLAVIFQKKEIRDTLLAAARKAREEERFFEAKVIYSFLGRQCPELLPRLIPDIEEIGSRALISLADIDRSGIIDFAALGLHVDENGFLESGPMAVDSSGVDFFGGRLTEIVPVEMNPEPRADTLSEPVDIDGEEVADFVY